MIKHTQDGGSSDGVSLCRPNVYRLSIGHSMCLCEIYSIHRIDVWFSLEEKEKEETGDKILVLLDVWMNSTMIELFMKISNVLFQIFAIDEKIRFHSNKMLVIIELFIGEIFSKKVRH